MPDQDTSHSGLNGSPSGRSLLRIPDTPADFLPPKTASISAEVQSLLRNPEEYAELKPYLEAVAGVGPTIHGSARYDEAGAVFLLEDICKRNGYTLLAKLNPAQLSRYLKIGFKGVTGLSFRMMLKQGRQLRLEHRRTGAAE